MRCFIGSTLAIVVPLVALAGCGRAGDLSARPGSAPVATQNVEPPALPKPHQASYQRDLYAKLDDCVTDWGFAGKCMPLAGDALERAQGATFFGPIYSNALRFEAQLAARREAVEQGYQQQLDED